MAKTHTDLSELLAKHEQAVPQLIMEADIDGLIGVGQHERRGERTTWRTRYQDRALDPRPGTVGLRGPKLPQGSCSPLLLEHFPDRLQHRATGIRHRMQSGVQPAHRAVRTRSGSFRARTPSCDSSAPPASRSTKNGPWTGRPASRGTARMRDPLSENFPDLSLRDPWQRRLAGLNVDPGDRRSAHRLSAPHADAPGHQPTGASCPSPALQDRVFQRPAGQGDTKGMARCSGTLRTGRVFNRR
nr:transposase [Rhodobaculum claviforme]